MVKASTVIILIAVLLIASVIFAIIFISKDSVAVKSVSVTKQVEVIKQSRHYPKKYVVYDGNSIEDGNLVYLLCDDDAFWQCKIIQEKVPFNNATRSCDVDLTVEGEVLLNYVFVVALGENKAILLWEDDKRKSSMGADMKISVIHLNECRQTPDFKLRDYQMNSINEDSDSIAGQLQMMKKIVTHNDSFEIFFKSPGQCGYQECKLTFDSEVRPLQGHVRYMNNSEHNIEQIYSISTHSTIKKYVYTKYHNKEPEVFIFSNGEEKYLGSLTGPSEMSVVNESIGICSRSTIDLNFTCWQYNSDGKLRFNTSLTDINNNTDMLNVYSLSEGGLLLNFIEYANCQTDCEEPIHLFLLKIDESGKPVGKLRFEGLQKEHKLIDKSQIWKNQDKKGYCVLVSPFYNETDRLDILVNCFTDTDFSI